MGSLHQNNVINIYLQTPNYIAMNSLQRLAILLCITSAVRRSPCSSLYVFGFLAPKSESSDLLSDWLVKNTLRTANATAKF